MPQLCYLCEQAQQSPKEDVKICQLCTRGFCEMHKGRFQEICQINHSSYAHDNPKLPNVYPSLGERERALMVGQSQAGFSKSQTKLLQAPLSEGGSESSGFSTANVPGPVPVEEKDVIGADIAV